MKKLLFLSYIFTIVTVECFSQNTVTSGNWSDPTVWSGGAVPLPGGTVIVNNPLTIDASLSPTGAMTFNSNATDQPGSTAYTFNPNAGTNTITISAAAIVTFEGGTAGTPNAFNSGTISIFGTLILGYTQINNSANMKIIVQPGGTLIINGNLINQNNLGTFTIDGTLIVNGNFDNQTGSITVSGSGTINTTGTLTSTGGSTIFGTTNDCNTGPCSGTTLSCTFTNTVSPVSKTICNGSSAGTLTSTNSATSPTYQWLSSTDNITYSNASGTSTNSTYVTPALTQTTWYKVRITSSGPCTSTSAAVKITVLTGGGWLGSTSNDWNTASNWCSNSVPTTATDVVITNASGMANMPTINVGTAATCKNLTISNTFPASSLTIAASATASLSILGDFTNNGTFIDNSTSSTGGVKLVGAVSQNITGTTANVFNNLTINNTSGITPAFNITSNNVAVNSNLTMTAGLINLGGYTITLGASAASSGTLTYSTGTWFYGGNIQRWFPTSAVAIGSNASLFPIGSASKYRPIYFGSSGLTTGGTIKVSHTSVSGSTPVSFSDAGTPIQVRSNSFWNVTTANGINGAGTPFTIRTEATGMGAVGAVTDLRLTLAAAAAPGSAGINAGTVTNPQVNRSAFSVANISNSFYWGSINSIQTPLPIVLVSFSGQQVADQINLNWETSMESNFSFFAIEKSNDATHYAEVGKVGNAGTTNYGHQYTYTDINPFIGQNYYRLKLVDLDGTFKYSKIILLDFNAQKKLIVFPNPSNGKSLTMKMNFHVDKEYSIAIFNTLGVVIDHYTSTQPEVTINFLRALPGGVYFARFSSPTFSVVTSFLVKNW